MSTTLEKIAPIANKSPKLSASVFKPHIIYRMFPTSGRLSSSISGLYHGRGGLIHSTLLSLPTRESWWDLDTSSFSRPRFWVYKWSYSISPHQCTYGNIMKQSRD